jgi:hypothetical protein
MYIFDYVHGFALAEVAAAEHGDLSEKKWQNAEEAYAKVLERYPAGWHAFMHHGSFFGSFFGLLSLSRFAILFFIPSSRKHVTKIG